MYLCFGKTVNRKTGFLVFCCSGLLPFPVLCIRACWRDQPILFSMRLPHIRRAFGPFILLAIILLSPIDGDAGRRLLAHSPVVRMASRAASVPSSSSASNVTPITSDRERLFGGIFTY